MRPPVTRDDDEFTANENISYVGQLYHDIYDGDCYHDMCPGSDKGLWQSFYEML